MIMRADTNARLNMVCFKVGGFGVNIREGRCEKMFVIYVFVSFFKLRIY